MRYLITTLAFIFFNTFLFSQQDTVLQIYPLTSQDWGINIELITLQNGNYCFLELNPGASQAVITNELGEVEYRLPFDSIDQFKLTICSAVFELDNKLIFICNAEKNGENFCVALSTKLDLTKMELLDTIQLDLDTRLLFNLFKLNENKNIFESFGTYSVNSINTILNNSYLSFDIDSKTLDLHHIAGTFATENILDFVFVPSKNLYVLTTFYSGVFLVSNEFDFLNYHDVIHQYHYNNITYNTRYQIETLTILPNEHVQYFGKTLEDTPFRFSAIEIDPTSGKDTAEILNINGIFLESGDVWTNPDILKDKHHDFIVTGSDRINIVISKLDSNFQRIWNIKYGEPNRTFLVWDTEIDNNNDIVVVGETYGGPNGSNSQGFLMKVLENGSFTVAYENPVTVGNNFNIFPNPASQYITFAFKNEKSSLFEIDLYDIQGKFIATKQSKNNSIQFEIRQCAAGTYFYTIKSENSFIQSGSFVKY